MIIFHFYKYFSVLCRVSERNSSLAERKPCISINLFNFLFLPQKVKGHFKEKEVNSDTLLIF